MLKEPKVIWNVTSKGCDKESKCDEAESLGLSDCETTQVLLPDL